MFTVGLPLWIVPSPPQCFVASPLRAAGFPLMLTVPEPFETVTVLGPQQGAWSPLSS
jgi:hypothetical protein